MRLVNGYRPAIADGDPMGVAGEISKNLLWPGKRTLGINDPLSVALRNGQSNVAKVILRRMRNGSVEPFPAIDLTWLPSPNVKSHTLKSKRKGSSV
jgi:hypothetical protein